MKPEVVAALSNPHLQLADGVALNTALRELIGLPAPVAINFSIGPVAVDVRQNRSEADWTAFLIDYCPFFVAADLARVAPLFVSAGATAPDLLTRMLSRRSEPIVAIQANCFRNRLVDLHTEATEAVRRWWQLSLDTEAHWATLFLTLHAESMVVAHVSCRLNASGSARPSPFVYAMA